MLTGPPSLRLRRDPGASPECLWVVCIFAPGNPSSFLTHDLHTSPKVTWLASDKAGTRRGWGSHPGSLTSGVTHVIVLHGSSRRTAPSGDRGATGLLLRVDPDLGTHRYDKQTSGVAPSPLAFSSLDSYSMLPRRSSIPSKSVSQRDLAEFMVSLLFLLLLLFYILLVWKAF